MINVHSILPVWQRVTILIMVFPWLIPGLVGQETPATAAEHIHSLREGVLIFVLAEQQRKIDFLINERGSEQSERQRRRTERLLQATITERDSFNLALKQAVKKHYTFSAYTFTTPSKCAEIKDSLEHELSQKGGRAAIFFAARSVTESGADALMISDRQQHPLTRPFPYYVRLTKVSSAFDAFFGAGSFSWRDLNKVVEKLSRRLAHYYEKRQ